MPSVDIRTACLTLLAIHCSSCAPQENVDVIEDSGETLAISVRNKNVVVNNGDAWLKTRSTRVSTLSSNEKCHIAQGTVLSLEDVKRDSSTRKVDLHIWISKESSQQLCPSFAARRDWYLYAGSYDPAEPTSSAQPGASIPNEPRKEPSNPIASTDTRAKQLGVLLLRPSDLDLNGHENFVHTRTVDTSRSLSEAEGRKLYFDGIVPLLSDSASWQQAHREGHGYTSVAECAYTNSAALESAGKLSGIAVVADVFANQAKFPCTNVVETTLRSMGWLYYPKSKYIVPKGAVGVLGHSSSITENCGVRNNHSGHIFIVMTDSDDRISDNGGFNRVYIINGSHDPTRGFWLPPGVYPRQR